MHFLFYSPRFAKSLKAEENIKIMHIRKSEIIIIAITLLTFIIALYFYPLMPAKIATHWNARGEVNGYMTKFWGLFLVPLMLCVMALLFIILPRIDPLRANIDRFRSYFDRFIILVFVFFALIHFFFSILWNRGTRISPNLILPMGLGLLFYYTGILLEHAERNWFIGIRTPWTLSSERVWKKTHKRGGILFKISGIIAVFSIFFQAYAFYFTIIPILLVALYTIVYSYYEYERETQ